MPLMGFAYFLQFLDKLALSQATLFNLREDLVGPHRTVCFSSNLIRYRISKDPTTPGHRPSSTLATFSGVGRART